MREEQERRMRMDQFHLKGKEDELAWRRELNLSEVTIKCQEEEIQAREAALKNKKDAVEPSSGHDRKGKQPCYRQKKNVVDTTSYIP
jgi:hypothetical protein